MNRVHALQRQQRKRKPLTTAEFSFAEPTRLFAPVAFTSASMLPSEELEHPTQVAQFRHALDRISIHPPVSSMDTWYGTDQSTMLQTGAHLSPLQRKEIGRPLVSQENAPLQLVAASGNTVYTIQSGDTLGQIAANYNTTWQALAQYNQITNPNLIYAGQQLNIPASGTNSPQPTSTPQLTNTPPPADTPPPTNAPAPTGNVPQHNTANLFLTGQCTWWANERYHQLTGYYVPWTTNSNADQWTARAYDFGWHVSDQPTVGAIIDFQAGVQLASSVGHVAIVEKIMPNGDLITSNMNILGHPQTEVVDLTNHAGPGVTFITYN